MELNKFGGDFINYTTFNLEQHEHWADDQVHATILKKWKKQ
jgi:hypothetical protein